MKEKRQYGSIEFLRFLFSVIIVYFHIIPYMIPYIGNAEASYKILVGKNVYAAYIVECFFIISGFFLHKTYSSHPEMSVLDFCINRIVRLWPMLFFAIILAVLTRSIQIYPAIFNALFLQCIGISIAYRGITWYISPFFWVSIFLFSILKNFDNKKVHVILPVMIYFSYVININYCEGEFGRETIWNFLNLGVLRAIAGIGLGYMIGVVLVEVKRLYKIHIIQLVNNKKRAYPGGGVLCSVVEISTLLFLLIYFLDSDTIKYNNQFIVIIIFTILFVFLIIGKGIVSRILNNTLSIFLGKYSYSIYVMQSFSFWILQRTFWHKTSFLENHMYISIMISVSFSIVLGYIAYHLIEEPTIKFYRNLKMKIRLCKEEID